LVTLAWNGRLLLAEAVPDEGISHREFWPPLVRFAFWVWVINLFCHLFGIVDRYMLVHYSGLENAEALGLVGQYHASRIVPVLFLSVANLLAGAVLPFLSHDWESGNRQQVSDRLNSVLKMTALVMLVGGVTVLWTAPTLFNIAFGGRYDQGLAVIPWTMTYCAWDSLLLVSQTYLWCAERNKLAVLPLGLGLVLNIAIDLALIPTWGLLGAVIGTTVATAAALALLYWLSHEAGVRIDRGMVLLSIAPAALCGGAWWGTAAVLVIAVALPFSITLFTQCERESLAAFSRSFVARLRAIYSRTNENREPSHAA
jgi:O-antigen/teichoic acid export membrane protein